MNIITPQYNAERYKQRKQDFDKARYSSPNDGSVSFKAAPASLITEADEALLKVFSQNYGNIGNRLGLKVAKLANESNILRSNARFSLEKGVSSIKPKTIGKSLLENLFFPITSLPLWSASWGLKKAQLIPSIKSEARKIYNKPLLRIPRKLNELDTKTDIIKGIFDKTDDVIKKFAKEKGIDAKEVLETLNNAEKNPEMAKEAGEFVKENLYKVSNKFFDKHTGNFNTAYERPLNRIVSGLIPVAFLANDAYNLSVLCGDDKEVSKKEARERRKQEISRVFTTAYIQLLTFGAFTKQVNTIPWFTPLTSAATVLFSETNSRRRLGKPIFFLSKDKAKEYNKKQKEKELNGGKAVKTRKIANRKEVEKTQPTEQKATVQENKKPAMQAINTNVLQNAIGDSKTFNSFKATPTSVADKKEQPKQTEKQENKKALINIKTFKKAVGFLTVAGLAVSFFKNSSYTKNSNLMKQLKKISSTVKTKVYNPIAFKDFEMPVKDFERITGNLKEAGCREIAEGHEFIKGKYAKTKDGMIKIYKSVLSSDKEKEVIELATAGLKESGAFTEGQIGEMAFSVHTAIKKNSSAIAENKFDNIAKKAIEIIRTKDIELTSKQAEELGVNITEAISSKVKEVPLQVETKAKPFVDILTEPFKFAMSVARLPLKIITSVSKIATSSITKKAAAAELGKVDLTKTEKAINKVVTDFFGSEKAKDGKISQTVFVNAVEQLNKKTMGYQKAKEALEAAKAQGAPKNVISKYQDKLAAEKEKLMIYVNTAVEKSFNGVTQSSNKNTDLAMMSKLASSLVTSAFLVADNYNMVMIKSDGENKEEAKERANERIIQRLSALFYQTLFINWFNSTFRAQYNSSLKGMSAVVIPNTLTTEIITRKSIGMPIGKKSYEQLQANEEKNENRKGFLGKYFKFMRLLTGKKPLSERMPKNKEQANKPAEVKAEVKQATTNLLQMHSKK